MSVVVRCFICDVDENLAQALTATLITPLDTIISDCLQTPISIENETFCMTCMNKIEEYDQLIHQSRQILRDLCEKYQNKAAKCEIEENEAFEHDSMATEMFIKSEAQPFSEQDVAEFEDHSNFKSLPQIFENQSIENIERKYNTRRNMCKRKSVNMTNVECAKNLKTVNPSKNYKIEEVSCDFCGRTYQSKGALGVHLVSHISPSPYECEICHKTFTQRIGLLRHMPFHTGEQQHQCDICGKRFIYAASINMHRKMHQNERSKKCTICGSAFHSSSHLSRHMRTHTGEKPFACSICGQKFAQRYNLRTHSKTHEKQQKGQSKNHKCLICPETFYRREKLKEHLAQVHQAAIDTKLPPNKSH